MQDQIQPHNPNEQSQVPEPPGSICPPTAPTAIQQEQTSPVKTSGLAVASLILGILGFISCALTGIVGLVLGIVSLSAISKSQGRLGGRGLATGGIVVSGITILIIPLMGMLAAIAMPAVYRARDVARHTVAMSHVQQLSSATMMYAAEHEGQLPDPDNWKELIEPYTDGDVDELLASPYDRETGSGLAMNGLLVSSVGGRRVPLKSEQIVNPAKTVLFFEARFDGPSAGGPELLHEEPRISRGYVVGFVDGHVENVTAEELDNLIWSPNTVNRVIYRPAPIP